MPVTKITVSYSSQEYATFKTELTATLEHLKDDYPTIAYPREKHELAKRIDRLDALLGGI